MVKVYRRWLEKLISDLSNEQILIYAYIKPAVDIFTSNFFIQVLRLRALVMMERAQLMSVLLTEFLSVFDNFMVLFKIDFVYAD